MEIFFSFFFCLGYFDVEVKRYKLIIEIICIVYRVIKIVKWLV